MQQQPVHDDVNVVLAVLRQAPDVGEVGDDAVHARADVSFRPGAPQDVGVLSLAAADHRGEDHHAPPLGGGVLQHGPHDFLGGLLGDRPAALVTEGLAAARVEEAQEVVDLRGRRDGRARAGRPPALLDGDGRRQPLDGLHVRLLHLLEELAGVGREALDVAALPLGVDGVEGQRRLARAGDAGDDDHVVAWDLDGDVFQIVLSCAPHDDLILCQRSPLSCYRTFVRDCITLVKPRQGKKIF